MTTKDLTPTDDAALYKTGIHLLMDDINPESCKAAVEFILKQHNEKRKQKRLQFLICSNGGDVPNCFALIDVMRSSKIPIHTVGLGVIASCGLLLFISGEKGNRTLTPNTSILSHQYSWGSYGKEHELFAQVKEYELSSRRLVTHYKRCTGLTEKDIKQYLLPPEDVWLSGQEAKKLGICDNIRQMS